MIISLQCNNENKAGSTVKKTRPFWTCLFKVGFTS